MCGFVDPKLGVAIIGGLSDVEAHLKKTESFCCLYSLLTGWAKVVERVRSARVCVVVMVISCNGERTRFASLWPSRLFAEDYASSLG